MVSGIRGVKFGPRDQAALELFLRTTANGEAIKRLFSEAQHASVPTHRAFYDSTTYTGAFVTSWRGRMVCLLALRVTATQAAGIESRLGYAGVAAWTSLPFFQDSVEAALGESINPGRPCGTYIAEWWRPDGEPASPKRRAADRYPSRQANGISWASPKAMPRQLDKL
jgi:hypothetical protein